MDNREFSFGSKRGSVSSTQPKQPAAAGNEGDLGGVEEGAEGPASEDKEEEVAAKEAASEVAAEEDAAGFEDAAAELDADGGADAEDPPQQEEGEAADVRGSRPYGDEAGRDHTAKA